MTGPAPEVAALRSAVTAATADLPDGALVLVACSGGPDSLALAAATAFVARRSTRASGRGSSGPLLLAGAVVVDHGLQPGSAQVAAAAAVACRTLGLDPVEVVRVRVAASGGPEAAARDARYAALDETARRLGAATVLLGHTLDDQAEQVLLGLARGAGGRSLAGMPARRGLLRRPLLGLRRTDTLAACAALGLEPWHDPTNVPAEPRVGPLRSRVRAHVLPVLEDELGPGVAEALARTADQLREDADALDALAADLLATSLVADDAPSDGTDRAPGGPPEPGRTPGTVRLDVEVLTAAAPALRRRALRAAAIRAGAPAGSVHRSHVLALDALLTHWHGQGPLDLPGIRAVRAYGRLMLQPDQ
ncbi:MAG TPA: tRNA lysidine(34) synthetase TilS [Cellulomonas sp.]|uniref:tRNA lysidine(34) synthetase TilS n=1 Tax=Cellulomonas sp. TaxID=40001 RepID=UPI002E3711A6|nr:tRNA lysidine(34) synthetase TilS [Cellulomonas sp.]HEX5332605.1 tRNA lysidine(34) synthetase TilS [Cellulomonas sp.]